MADPLKDTDREEIKTFIRRHWHAPHICVRGRLHYPHDAEGFVVRHDGLIVGLITYQCNGQDVLLLSHNSTETKMGIGSSLLLRVIEEARKRNARRIWLTTTNDNLKAMGFYQRMGFRIVKIYPGAVDEARRTIKPEVPEFGKGGLPIHDEIELELILEPIIREDGDLTAPGDAGIN